MPYATYLQDGQSRVGEVRGTHLVPLTGLAELGATTTSELLANAERDESAATEISDVVLRPIVPNPTKVFCVGLNYRDHVLETKRELPSYPVLFPKYASSLIGARDDIVLPSESTQVDYEGEMAIVIGRSGRRIERSDALAHVMGYTVANDVTMRDFQYKTHQWMQGKVWDVCTPIGPYLVTPNEIDIEQAGIRTILNGEKMQESELSQLIFDVPELIATISTFSTLQPGDMILTGTPGGVGYRRQPQVFLNEGDRISVEIDGIGTVSNLVRR
ncbi:2-hydroxyhepta-2,4-diene-1,7-dioate isomerase [Mycobacterium paraense]|uniref:2-hydroxyhepta-2,4-diene-1,7-dioate isomerase n=1 Tax=Mycobacterium paraense TaxID=767916 RepID=A0A1X2A6K2_9MYCO|nr:fumarylacetoacetate hydrolase family protein [Mycobacterium paraense]ORW41759.1 2-hydroxyhepta-2,4-diene-1,7-dioate isomerase [Mycobacterium paraense]